MHSPLPGLHPINLPSHLSFSTYRSIFLYDDPSKLGTVDDYNLSIYFMQYPYIIYNYIYIYIIVSIFLVRSEPPSTVGFRLWIFCWRVQPLSWQPTWRPRAFKARRGRLPWWNRLPFLPPMTGNGKHIPPNKKWWVIGAGKHAIVSPTLQINILCLVAL